MCFYVFNKFFWIFFNARNSLLTMINETEPNLPLPSCTEGSWYSKSTTFLIYGITGFTGFMIIYFYRFWFYTGTAGLSESDLRPKVFDGILFSTVGIFIGGSKGFLSYKRSVPDFFIMAVGILYGILGGELGSIKSMVWSIDLW